MGIMKIKNITDQIRGVSYKPYDVVTIKNGLPILRANNIKDNRLNFDELVFIKPEKVSKNQLLQDGDIVICASSGSKELVGKAGIFYGTYLCSFGAFCKCIRVKNLNYINTDYIRLYFKSKYYRECIALSSKGSNINNIKTENIEDLDINVPSVEEQNKAVFLLNSLLSAIDDKKQTLFSLDELVKSRFIEMFDDKYETKPLSEVCEELFAGGDVKKDKSSDKQSELFPYPIYTNGEKDNGLYGYTSLVRVSKEAVTISGRGTIGFTCLRKEPFYPAVRLIVAVPNQSLINGCYLQHFIQSKNYGGQGASIPQLTVPMIKNELIPLPPIRVQKEFQKYVELIDKSKFVYRFIQGTFYAKFARFRHPP